MAATLLCDDCGRELTEEDLGSGRAIRRRSEVFCAECAAMHTEDGERGRKERKDRQEADVADKADTPPSVAETFRRMPRRTRNIVVAAGLALVTFLVVLGVLIGAYGRSGPGEERPPATADPPTPAEAGTGSEGLPAAPGRSPSTPKEGLPPAESPTARPVPPGPSPPPVASERAVEGPPGPAKAAGEARSPPGKRPELRPELVWEDWYAVPVRRVTVTPEPRDPGKCLVRIACGFENRDGGRDIAAVFSEGLPMMVETPEGTPFHCELRRPAEAWTRPGSHGACFELAAVLPADVRALETVSGMVSVIKATGRRTLVWEDPAARIGEERTAGGFRFVLSGYRQEGDTVHVDIGCTFPPEKQGEPRQWPFRLSNFALRCKDRLAGAFRAGAGPGRRSFSYRLEGGEPTAYEIDVVTGVERMDLLFELKDVRLPGAASPPVRARRPTARPVVRRPAPASTDVEKLPAPLPRTERRRLPLRAPRPLTKRDLAEARTIIARLKEPVNLNDYARTSKRRADLQKLARYDHPDVSRQLAFLAADRDYNVRYGLVDVLAKHGNPESVKMLVKLVASVDESTSKRARTTLASLRNGKAVEWLYVSGLLRAKPARARAEIASALGQLGEERSIPYLRRALRDGDAEVRSESAMALGKMRATEAASAIVRLMSDRAAYVRAAALLALGSIRDEKWTGTVTRHLRDTAPGVRRAAVQACGALRTQEVVEPLIEALRREPGGIKGEVLRALAVVTGMSFGDDVGEWKRWWSTSKESFKVPPVDRAVAALRGVEREETGYYGIRIYSKRVIFVFDITSYMTPSTLAAAKAELEKALRGFARDQFFNIIFYNYAPIPWKKKLTQATEPAVAAALADLQQLVAGGGYDMSRALIMALRDRHVETVFLLSASSGSLGLSRLPADVRKANATRGAVIHCIGIGGSYDREVMEALARENGGRFITPGWPTR